MQIPHDCIDGNWTQFCQFNSPIESLRVPSNPLVFSSSLSAPQHCLPFARRKYIPNWNCPEGEQWFFTMSRDEAPKSMLRSSSEKRMRIRMDGPTPRPLRQRSIKLCRSSCLGSEDHDSIISEEDQGQGQVQAQAQGCSWPTRGNVKSSHYHSRNDDDDMPESWWQKGWTHSVKKAGDQWSNLMEEAGGCRTSGLKWRWRWRWTGKWLKREPCMISSIVYSRKPVHCNYDEMSYAQNFDEGDWREEDIYPYRAFSARFAAPAFPLAKPTEA